MAFTVVTQNMDWSAAAFLNELTSAQRDREAACQVGLSDIVVDVGDDVQAHDGIISVLQACSIGLRVQGWLDPTPANYDGEAALPADIASDAALLTLAGLPDGFRRATTPPTDWTDYGDAAYAYGVMQVDDIIGPWLFVDLQAVYNVLTRQNLTVNFTGYVGNLGQVSYIAGWAAAKAAAEADWQVQGGLPIAASTYGNNKGGGDFNAAIRRATTQFTAPNAPIGQVREITWYVKPEVTGLSGNSVFDDQGDIRLDTDPIVEGELNLMLFEEHDGTAGGGTFTSTGKIGSVLASTKPDWCAEPVTDRDLGWTADDYAATIDWLFDDQI